MMNRNLEHLFGFMLGILTFGFYPCVDVSTHHYMVDDSLDCKKVIKASFAEFRREFEKVDWKICECFRDSLFTNDGKSVFHASIIRINNAGYKLTSYGLIRANRVRRKKIKELNER